MKREQLRLIVLAVSRFLGRLVCRVKGHKPHYPFGSWNNWSAYSCIRCGELDRPLESLPAAPGWDEPEYEDWDRHDRDEQIAERRFAARWFGRLPWPRWVQP